MKRLVKIFFVLVLLIVAGFGAFLAYAIRPSVSESEFPSAATVDFPEFSARALPQAPEKLTVVTYNIGYGSGDKNNQGRVLTKAEVEANLAQMAAALKKLDPQILALQEVDFRAARSFDIDQFRYLAKALEMPFGAYVVTWNKNYIAWPYWPISRHFGRVVSGQALLSRFPIVGREEQILPKPESNPFWYNWFYLERILERADLKVGDTQWSVFNVHLEAFDANQRLDQLAALVLMVRAAPAPTRWALGDFNLATWTSEGATENEKDVTGGLVKFADLTNLRIAQSEAPYLTMPSTRPVKKIDHIFYPQGVTLQANGNIPDLLASDHLPAWAEFTLP